MTKKKPHTQNTPPPKKKKTPQKTNKQTKPKIKGIN